jgi:hypothetical protein
MDACLCSFALFYLVSAKDLRQVNLQLKKPNQCVKVFTVTELILDLKRPEDLIQDR